MRLSYPVFFIVILAQIPTSLDAQSYRVTPWADNKKAAVTVTLDDNTEGQFKYGVPVMNEKGIKSAFFINAKSMDWELAEEAIITGHEIGNHTYSHANLLKSDTATIDWEIKTGYDIIKAKIPSQTYVSFAYPGGQGRGSTAKDDTVRMFVKRYHINGRGIRTAGFDIGNKGFDMYDEYLNPLYHDYYYQTGTFSLDGSTTTADFKNTLNDAIAYGGWFTPLYHGIEVGGISVVPLSKFTAQMEVLDERKEDCWITTYGKATCYHKERQAATLKEVEINYQQWILELTDSLDDAIYQEPLTVRLFVPDSIKLKNIVQNSLELNIIEEGDTIQFNAIPDGGYIIINREIPLPEVPSQFVAEALSASEISLSWKENSPEPTKFLLERSMTEEGELVTIRTIEGSVRSFIDNELDPDTYYYYRIQAANEIGSSEWSAKALVKTLKEVVPCEIPRNLMVEDITSNSAKLSWSEVSNAEGYQLYYKKLAEPESEGETLTTEGELSVTVSDLLPETEYEWAVKSGCSGSDSDFSAFSELNYFKTDPVVMAVISPVRLELKVFPIPSDGTVTIIAKEKGNNKTSLVLYNYMGEELLSQEGQTSNTHTIDLRYFGGKVFVLKVVNDNGDSVTRKIFLN